MEALIESLKAVAEPTRVRLLAVLAESELAVRDLCHILGQSQPRISRHLKLLVDGGVLERNRQGSSAFFRPARDGDGRKIFDLVVGLVDADDAVIRRDRRRLDDVRAERSTEAGRYFDRIAADWDHMRTLHVEDAQVEAALLAAVDGIEIATLLDVGTGTGRILELFADRIEHGTGIDPSQPMLDLARSRLDEAGLRHCAVRQGDVYDLAGSDLEADVAVLHHVLHFLDNPEQAIEEVAAVLSERGRLLIVDFAPHPYETLRDDFAHYWLGLSDEQIATWCEAAGLGAVTATHLVPQPADGREPLTVTVWCAQRPGVADEAGSNAEPRRKTSLKAVS